MKKQTSFRMGHYHIEHLLSKALSKVNKEIILISTEERNFKKLFFPAPYNYIIIKEKGKYRFGFYHEVEYHPSDSFVVLILAGKEKGNQIVDVSTSIINENRFLKIKDNFMVISVEEISFLESLCKLLNHPGTEIFSGLESTDPNIKYNSDDDIILNDFELYCNYLYFGNSMPNLIEEFKDDEFLIL
jgi:hypothetical protein